MRRGRVDGRWKDESGMVALVEGSVLFPITFFLVFLVLTTAFLFYGFLAQEGRIRWGMMIPSNNGASVQDSMDFSRVRGDLSTQERGILIKKTQVDVQRLVRPAAAMRFFHLNALTDRGTQRTVVTSSEVDNLRHIQAINAFAHQISEQR